MGIYSEYLDKGMDWPALEKERKKLLRRISALRDNRAILTIASALNKDAPIAIDYNDRLPVFDQISNLKGDKVDIILETPGGSAEVVEDIVEHIRNNFSYVGMIIPGYAKSAGTIMVMSGDEILMESSSALGPIDAQIIQAGKQFSAHAFLEGLERIKNEIEEKGQLNRAYIPILQNISPGEIQTCDNALNFSKKLVTDWLSEYKFKYWDKHLSTGAEVTQKEKVNRAGEIASVLCDHSKWLTHGRSITISDLSEMRLKVTDYSANSNLCDAIRRYYTLLRMSFDTTNIYKIYETKDSQINQIMLPQGGPIPSQTPDFLMVEIRCPQCKETTKLQANLKKGVPVQSNIPTFPKNNKYDCPSCGREIDLGQIRMQIESQTKQKIK